MNKAITDDANMNETLKNILEFSPPMALLVALVLLGFFLRRTPLQGWTIPFILMSLGGIIYPFIAELAKITNYTVRSPATFAVLTGVCIGGAATGLHQLGKKFLERNLNFDVDVVEKKEDSNEK